MGCTGSGKSSFGNTLLKKENYFKVGDGFSSVTERVRYGAQFILDDGELVTVVDTPGFFDTEKTPSEVVTTLQELNDVAHGGINAFLIVIKAGVWDDETTATLKIIEQVFGPSVFEHSIFIFTKTDELERPDDLRKAITYGKKTEDLELRKWLNKCNTRYIGINNKDQARAKRSLYQLYDMLTEFTGSYDIHDNNIEKMMSDKAASWGKYLGTRVKDRSVGIRILKGSFNF